MNKGECGELLTLAYACCDFKITRAGGSSSKTLVAVGKAIDKKTIRLLVKDTDDQVYANNYPRAEDKKKRIVLPKPTISDRGLTLISMPDLDEFRLQITQAVRAVAEQGDKQWRTDKNVKAVLRQLEDWGFKLKAANASSKEDIYVGFRRDAQVLGISVKTMGLAGDAALLNASLQTRALWKVETEVDLLDFPFPFVKGADGSPIVARNKDGTVRWRKKEKKIPRYEVNSNWLRESLQLIKKYGSLKLILPSDDLIDEVPKSARLNKGGAAFAEKLGSDSIRLLAAVSLLRLTDPPPDGNPNLQQILDHIYATVDRKWFHRTIGMKMPKKETAMSHLETALMSFSRGLTPTTASNGWRSESAVSGIAFLVYDERDQHIYFRYFEPNQDEKEVIDFTVDHASPDTASTFRHQFGFLFDKKGKNLAEDKKMVPLRFYGNNEIVPAGTYYLHTIIAFRHRPDVSLFKKEYLDRWRAEEAKRLSSLVSK